MYDHKKSEKEILEYWEKNKIFEKVKKKNSGNPTFYFCDGPPYATGQIHPGTGWNKTIKDSLCRYYRAIGRDVRAQPGYDTHGLPIEVKVEQELKFKHKSDIEEYGIDKFIEKCKAFATKYIGIMNGQFQSLGVWMNFDDPYITYHDSYINSSWSTLKMAHEKGLMYEDVYVLPYCYRCETTIANYELEYGDETDPSIFVKFKLKTNEGKSERKGEGKSESENEFLVIWTTTPWTLPANLAVMVHPTLPYVKAKVGDEVWIVAKDRLDYLMNLVDKSATVLEEIPGRKLNGLEYHHPFQDKIHKFYNRKVVLSDEFVTLEEGTGLVHTSPGHGPADFIIGKRFGIEAFCPVDGTGSYTQDAGIFAGKNVRACNPEIIALIRSNGSLVHEQRIKHRYPHCWRCKTPLIFLTTKQWFISISKIKDQMISEIEKTEWHPDFAKERFKEFVSGAPDWCISRQRYWGIPLPIWKCTCGEVQVIGSSKDLPKMKELHKPYIDEIELPCKKCKKKTKRIPDVLDVWFDSGNAIWASLSENDAEKYSERADLILEGQDQIRGWFYSLLGSGVIRYNQCPYKKILMHGFFVDEKGEKMSKSVGNFVPLEQILEKYGADSFRMWGLSSTVWDELKFSWDEMKKCSSDLNIILNMIVFLDRFYPKKKLIKANLNSTDEWILSRLNSTLKTFRSAMENCELNNAVKALRSFIVDDVSRFYMKIAKDRISGGGEDSEGALFALYEVMLTSLKMLGCVCPLISEHLYQFFFKKYENEDSLFLLSLPGENSNLINTQSEKQMRAINQIFSAAMVGRQAANIKVRWPIRTLHLETTSHEVSEAAKAFEDVLLLLINAKSLSVANVKPTGDLALAAFESGNVYVDKKIDESLYEEGMMNEVKRRVQMLRKEAQLVESDKIEISFNSEKELEEIVKRNEKMLKDGVNASKVNYEIEKKMTEYTLDGRLVKIAIKKL
ncbi:isoleucine--tRNA ligase [Candidatus Micrarchaeota archaeon]|nr:isoleucine--tRNA ligase [Candidatus Micrarchaeota archaeon]